MCRPNLSGSIVGFLCTFVYQRYSPTRDLSMYLLGSVVVIASLIAGYLGNAQIVGGIGSILSVAVMAAPLSVVTTVINERSTDALPFSSRFLHSHFCIFSSPLISLPVSCSGLPHSPGLFTAPFISKTL